MPSPPLLFTAIVLAGDRGPHDPVATAAKVPCKAFTLIANKPMIVRVLETLATAESIGACILSGPKKEHLHEAPDLQQQINSQHIQWTPPQATPSSSTHFVLQTISPTQPILLTTADHALLSPAMVEHFCAEARKSQSDVVVGLVKAHIVTNAYPDSKRTILKFGKEGYCGCNLYAFLTPQGRKAAQFWQQMEQNRKKPWRLIRVLGWLPLLRYGLGRLTLEEALAQLSQRLEITIRPVFLPFAEAAIDVDSVSDWKLAEKIIQQNTSNKLNGRSS